MRRKRRIRNKVDEGPSETKAERGVKETPREERTDRPLPRQSATQPLPGRNFANSPPPVGQNSVAALSAMLGVGRRPKGK